MKLLYVISNSRIGGAENYTLRLAAGMRREFPGVGIDCLLTHTSGDLYKQYKATFDNLPQLWRRDDKADLLGAYLAQHKYDLVHSMDNYDLWADVRSAACGGHRVIQSVFLDATLPKHLTYLDRIWRASRNYSALLTEIEHNLISFPSPGRPPNIVKQVPNGIDTDFWTPGAQESKVCWVGRLTKEKGGLILAELIRTNPGIKFHVVANEPNVEPGFLHGAFQALDIVSDNLTYQWGLSPEALREIYRSSKVYLHTSLSEAQPGTLLEAMSCGCYPVAGAVGGVPSIVGGCGILVCHGGEYSPEKTETALAQDYSVAMKWALNDGINSDPRQKIIENHSLRANIEATARVYREVMAA